MVINAARLDLDIMKYTGSKESSLFGKPTLALPKEAQSTETLPAELSPIESDSEVQEQKNNDSDQTEDIHSCKNCAKETTCKENGFMCGIEPTYFKPKK